MSKAEVYVFAWVCAIVWDKRPGGVEVGYIAIVSPWDPVPGTARGRQHTHMVPSSAFVHAPAPVLVHEPVLVLLEGSPG